MIRDRYRIALNFTLICMSVPALHEDDYEKPYIEYQNVTNTYVLDSGPKEALKIANNVSAKEIPPLILNTTHFLTELSKMDLASDVSLKTTKNETIFGDGLQIANVTNENSTQEKNSSDSHTSIFFLQKMQLPTKRITPASPTENRHGPEHAPVFDYSSQQKAQLMWAVGVGSLLGTLPFSWLCTHYGARYILFGAGLISCASTVMIPFAAALNFYFFLFLRFLQGVAYAADSVSIGMVCSRWSSLKQYAFFMSVLVAPLGSTVTNFASGLICESRFGWPMVFYAHAAACLLLMIFWVCLYNDHPNAVSGVSEIELEKINRNKTKAHIEMDANIPYKKIFTDRVIWSVWINAFAENCTVAYLGMYMPSYLKFVLDYGVQNTGFLVALPTLLVIPSRILFGYLSDKLSCVRERNKILIYNTVAMALSGIVFAFIGYVPGSAHPICVIILFVLIYLFLGLTPGAFYKCGALYSRQFYHIVSAVIQVIKCFSLVAGTLLMTLFVRDETKQEQWRKIFLIFAVLLFSVNILFCFFTTDTEAEFTNDRRRNRRRKSSGFSNDELRKKLSLTRSRAASLTTKF